MIDLCRLIWRAFVMLLRTIGRKVQISPCRPPPVRASNQHTRFNMHVAVLAWRDCSLDRIPLTSAEYRLVTTKRLLERNVAPPEGSAWTIFVWIWHIDVGEGDQIITGERSQLFQFSLHWRLSLLEVSICPSQRLAKGAEMSN
jgi:hypothetical protein